MSSPSRGTSQRKPSELRPRLPTQPSSSQASPGRLRQVHVPASAASAGRPRTTAHAIVAALALPEPCPASPAPARPLPLTSLHRLPRDTSMLYDIGPVDASGRVANREIVKALRWQPGDKLEIILTSGAIVIRASPDGLFCVPQKPRIMIPATARRRHAISAGHRVLLAAAPDFGIVIVYPPSALDKMISRHHSTYPADDISPA
jgi:bifunctional DNA-binding transcriptional regulator/antitoxin component of YhaV-PrlF toxin-antitoxin module